MPVHHSTSRGWVLSLVLGGVLTGAALGLPGLIVRTSAASPAGVLGQDDGRSEEFRWQGQIQPGQSVEVRGVNGPIRAEPSTTGQVEIHARKTGRNDDPRTVRIVVVPHAEGVTVCALYPDVDGEPNECRPGGGGRNNTRDNDVKVDFSVRIPAGATFNGRTVNGGITAKDLDGRAHITTVNGSVELNTSGYASAKTVNGSITAHMGRADWDNALELKTVNGSIELHVPPDMSADIEAQTVNGRITSDLPIQLHELKRRSLKGTIGSGGRALSLATVNGSITLKSGG